MTHHQHQVTCIHFSMQKIKRLMPHGEGVPDRRKSGSYQQFQEAEETGDK